MLLLGNIAKRRRFKKVTVPRRFIAYFILGWLMKRFLPFLQYNVGLTYLNHKFTSRNPRRKERIELREGE